MSHQLKRVFLATAATAVAITLAACSSSSESSSSSSTSSAAATTAASAAASSAASSSAAAGSDAPGSSSATADAFPVSIPNAFGTTEIPAAPERVAVIGYTEGDTVLALGVVPVSVYEFAFPGEVGGPWATELITGEAPVVLTGELNVEQVASLQPDLIIGINQALTQQLYDQLTAIAPTVARPAEYTDYGVPNMVQAQLIGQALGKSAEVEELGAAIQTQLDDAAAANPEFEGKTVSVVWPQPDGSWFAWSSTDPRVQLMESLGMVLTPGVEALGTDAFYHTVSAENTEQIDADVIVVLDAGGIKATTEADPVYQALTAAQNGSVVWVTDQTVIGALSYGSVLSLPYAIDAIVPLLADALAGGAVASSGAVVTTS